MPGEPGRNVSTLVDPHMTLIKPSLCLQEAPRDKWTPVENIPEGRFFHPAKRGSTETVNSLECEEDDGDRKSLTLAMLSR